MILFFLFHPLTFNLLKFIFHSFSSFGVSIQKAQVLGSHHFFFYLFFFISLHDVDLLLLLLFVK